MTTCPAVTRRFVAVSVALVLAGCSTIVIHSDGKVVTQNHVGVVKVTFSEPATTAIALSSLGLVLLPGSVALGWTEWKGVSIRKGEASECLFITFDAAAHEE